MHASKRRPSLMAPKPMSGCPGHGGKWKTCHLGRLRRLPATAPCVLPHAHFTLRYQQRCPRRVMDESMMSSITRKKLWS